MVAKKNQTRTAGTRRRNFQGRILPGSGSLGRTVHVLQGMREPKRGAVHLSGEAPTGNGVMRDRCISNRQE